MKIIDVITIIMLIILGILAYYLFGFFFFRESPEEFKVPDIASTKSDSEISRSTKGKSVINLDSCDFRSYEMDCKITKFLEENLAWSNKEEGVNFCSYEYLGRQEDNIYITALCQEFYISKRKMVCPNTEILNKCFVSKDKSECSECNTEPIEKRIVEGGGVSIPVRLTSNGDSFIMWTPRDGSFYQKDLVREFPKNIYSLLSESKKNLKAINIERAESYFGASAFFNAEKILEDPCASSLDCKTVPGEYALKSNCPHEMRCIDKKCNVGCYDLIDHFDLPVVAD